MAEPVAVIRENPLGEVRVALDTVKGVELVDVRVSADFWGADAERRPTKKGLSRNVYPIMQVTKVSDPDTNASPGNAIEITPAMIDAGAKVIAEWMAEEALGWARFKSVAEQVYLAIANESDCRDSGNQI